MVFDLIREIRDGLPEFELAKYRAHRVDKQRNRYFRFNDANLRGLQMELLQGLVYEVEMNDNQLSEEFEFGEWYVANRHGMRFALDLTRRRPAGLRDRPADLPLRGCLMVDWNQLRPASRDYYLALCWRLLSWLKPLYADFYVAPNANMCFDHWLGVLSSGHGTSSGTVIGLEGRNPYTLWGLDNERGFQVDRTPLDGEFLDVLVRDAYPGLFLDEKHIALLGGKDAIRQRTSYEIIESIGNGMLLLLSNDPAEWSDRDMRAKMLELEEMISPISLSAFAKQDYDYRMIEARAKTLRNLSLGVSTFEVV